MHRFHPVKRYSASYHHRKAATIAVTVVATLAIFAGAAGATAWFMAEGHTTSTDTVASGWSYPVTVTAGTLSDDLQPGMSSSPIQITVTNNNLESVEFPGVWVSVTGTSGGGTSGAGCDDTDFTVQQPTSYYDGSNYGNQISTPYSMPSGDIVTAYGATVTLNSDASTDCAGATVNLSEVVGET
jgi:hypothetical protein